MSEPISTGTLIGAAVAAVSTMITSAVSWAFSRHIKRIDHLDSRVGTLEQADNVSSDDLDKTVTRIETKVGEVHTRLDDIYKILIHKGA